MVRLCSVVGFVVIAAFLAGCNEEPVFEDDEPDVLANDPCVVEVDRTHGVTWKNSTLECDTIELRSQYCKAVSRCYKAFATRGTSYRSISTCSMCK